LMRNCWVQGSGYIMKQEVVQRLGKLRANESFPSYCLRAESAGYINGFPYPFIPIDHFDDPRSPYSMVKDDEDLRRHLPLSARQFRIQTVECWVGHHRGQARLLQQASYEHRDYTRLWPRLLKRAARVFGGSYFPKAQL
jgi:hypothetical protein